MSTWFLCKVVPLLAELLFDINIFSARLAQSVEHQTFKAVKPSGYLRVKGSSPLVGVFTLALPEQAEVLKWL